MTRPASLAPPRPSAAARWPWAFALAAALAIAGGVALDRWRNPATPALDPATLRPWFGSATFAEAVAAADQGVAGRRETLALAPAQWVSGEALASALIMRWRLTGDYADLDEAQRLLDAGVAETSGPSGPLVAAAALAVLVHRLDRADAALTRFADAVAPESREAADAVVLAGDVALQRGMLDAARAKYALAVRIAPSATSDVRLALFPAIRGDSRRAAAELEAMIATPRQAPIVLAGLMLQRANLAYAGGEWTAAGRWIGAAQRVFPGWWLADAYAAQQFALAGRTGEAIRAYEIVARRTGRPEVQDALAHLLRLKGQREPSRAWAAKAAAGWDARAQMFPEAVIHHRAEHELAVGSAARALAYAQTDAAARPQAPNLVLLARALLSAGRARAALAALDRADAQGWVSAGQAMARAEVLAALGDSAGSEAARARAETINPRATDPRARLIWFGHD